MIEVYFDNTATAIKVSSTIAYPVHKVLLNFKLKFGRYFVDR